MHTVGKHMGAWRWMVASLAMTSLLAACTDEEEEGNGDTPDIGEELDTTPDTRPDRDTTPDVEDTGDDTETDTGEDSVDDTEDPDGSDTTTRPDTGEEPECQVTADCGSREMCVEGVCMRRCASSVDCNDNNVCTSEVCSDEGYCVYSAVDTPIADSNVGDCRKLACVDGRLLEVPSPEDVPADDGIYCTVEQCSGAFPVYFPNHTLCDDGDNLNGYERCAPDLGGCAVGDAPTWVCDTFEPGWEDDEVCGAGVDNHPTGQVDEGCPCEFGSVQRCFAGPPNARAVGGCLDGYQQCVDRNNPRWSECQGGILPSEEICDAKDNDCNGCVDDLADCSPILTCPTEDVARPLRYYPLDATALFGAIADEITWTVIAPPNSATRTVENPNAANTRVYLDVSGDYQISLTVRDEKGTLYGCSWIVVVSGSGLRVEMRWDTFGRVDMDLHLARNMQPFCTSNDCYYSNCRVYSALAWGYAPSPASECDTDGGRSCPNPRLDIDNISGYDPENINIDNPNNGDRFRVMAHMFSGSARTNPVVSLYCGGTLNAVFGEAPDQAGLTQSGAGCMGQTWRVADVITNVDARTGVTTCTIFPLSNSAGGWDIRNGTSAH